MESVYKWWRNRDVTMPYDTMKYLIIAAAFVEGCAMIAEAITKKPK